MEQEQADQEIKVETVWDEALLSEPQKTRFESRRKRFEPRSTRWDVKADTISDRVVYE